jgi:N-hydroxyarylamine O-acetyltransferase
MLKVDPPRQEILDTDTRELLLRRIGLLDVPAADAAGLRLVHRAFVSHIPYEDLAVQLGESRPLDPPVLVQRILRDGRGGYCFEINTVLHALLEALGFAVERRQGIVGARGDHARGEPTNHMALVVEIPGEGRFIAEGGWGEGPLDPLPLIEGPVTSGLFELAIERDGEGWWVAQHEFGATPGFWFADRSATLADFQPHHLRLSSSPDSNFVKNLIVQRPFDDRVVTLRARTLFVDGPHVYRRRVLADERALASALGEQFGIDPAALGQDRLDRLWRQATAQHEAHHPHPMLLYRIVRAWRAWRRAIHSHRIGRRKRHSAPTA